MTNPLPHCNYCPQILNRFDSCPLLPHVDILTHNGQDPINILVNFFSQDIVFYHDFLMALITLWVYTQAIVISLIFLKNRTIRNGALLFFYIIAKVSCDFMKSVFFREPRPIGSCSAKFGLPSCHSQLAGLYFTWIILTIFVYPKMKFSKFKAFECLLMLAIPYSRIHLIYHSVKQIFLGFIFGIILAIIGIYTVYKLEKKQINQSLKINKAE